MQHYYILWQLPFDLVDKLHQDFIDNLRGALVCIKKDVLQTLYHIRAIFRFQLERKDRLVWINVVKLNTYAEVQIRVNENASFDMYIRIFTELPRD